MNGRGCNRCLRLSANTCSFGTVGRAAGAYRGIAEALLVVMLRDSDSQSYFGAKLGASACFLFAAGSQVFHFKNVVFLCHLGKWLMRNSLLGSAAAAGVGNAQQDTGVPVVPSKQ